jgi:hypothetical protein
LREFGKRKLQASDDKATKAPRACVLVQKVSQPADPDEAY